MSKSYSLTPTAVKAWKLFCDKLGFNESQVLDRLIISCCESYNNLPDYDLLGNYLKTRICEYLKNQEQWYPSDEFVDDSVTEIEEIKRYFNDLKDEWSRLEKQQKKKHIVYCNKEGLLDRLRQTVPVDEELIAEALQEEQNNELRKCDKKENL